MLSTQPPEEPVKVIIILGVFGWGLWDTRPQPHLEPASWSSVLLVVCYRREWPRAEAGGQGQGHIMVTWLSHRCTGRN